MNGDAKSAREYSQAAPTQNTSNETFDGRGITIGIRDSGAGGLTVARCVKAVLPAAQLLYFADTAHVPYGEKSAAQVRHYALSIADFLISRGAQMLIFACNTSSAIALDDARRKFSQPVLGTIQPGARAALDETRNGRIGIIATAATVSSGVYSRTIHKLNRETFCCEVACPAFVPLVESENVCGKAARAAAKEYLAPLLESEVDCVVLGCTHYPLLLPVLREAAPQMRFVDPAQAVAQEAAQIARVLAPQENAETRDVFFASGERDGLRHWIAQLLPQDGAIEIQRAPVFDL